MQVKLEKIFYINPRFL